MNEFKDSYQSAIEDMDLLGMKEVQMDAASCMDKRLHRKRVARQAGRSAVRMCSAMCVVLVCGLGTVKGAEYIRNVIRVEDWGFASGDAATMSRQAIEEGQVWVIEEEVVTASIEDDGSSQPEPEAGPSQSRPEAARNMPAEMASSKKDAEPAADVAEAEMAEKAQHEEQAGWTMEEAIQPAAGMGEEDARQQGEALSQDALAEGDKAALLEDAANTGQSQSASREEITQEAALADEALAVKSYASIEEFESNEDIVFPQPSADIGGVIQAVDFTVCGNWAMARYEVEGRVLWLERTDYANTQGHSASKVFPGGVSNERSYTTGQGYTYTLVDSVKGNEDEPLQIHAAVTVGTYEAFIDFLGYTEEEAKRIMDSIDLKAYENTE